jgi:hypothetical protein
MNSGSPISTRANTGVADASSIESDTVAEVPEVESEVIGIDEAAMVLGVSRMELYRQIYRFHIDDESEWIEIYEGPRGKSRAA